MIWIGTRNGWIRLVQHEKQGKKEDTSMLTFLFLFLFLVCESDRLCFFFSCHFQRRRNIIPLLLGILYQCFDAGKVFPLHFIVHDIYVWKTKNNEKKERKKKRLNVQCFGMKSDLALYDHGYQPS